MGDKYFPTDAGDGAVSRWFSRLVRRLLRVCGVLLVFMMCVFLADQHLLRPFLMPATGTGTAQAAAPPTVDGGEKRKLLVCFGYADLEGGIVTLNPSQPGRIDGIVVKENELVPAGAPLLRLDDRAARLRVEESRALLEEATARLAKTVKAPEQHVLRIAEQQAAVNMARYRLASARHSYSAKQERLKGDGIGRRRDDPTSSEEVASTAERVKEFEEVLVKEEKHLASLQLQDPIVDRDRVQAEVAATRARLQQAEQVLEEQTLRAPEAGKILRILVTPGEYVTVPPRRMAIQFCPDRPRIIRAEVEQEFAMRLDVGQPALVEDDGASGATWRGRVLRVSDWYAERRQINEEHVQFKDVRTLECLIAIDPGQPPLRISQRVRVTINRPGA